MSSRPAAAAASSSARPAPAAVRYDTDDDDDDSSSSSASDTDEVMAQSTAPDEDEPAPAVAEEEEEEEAPKPVVTKRVAKPLPKWVIPDLSSPTSGPDEPVDNIQYGRVFQHAGGLYMICSRGADRTISTSLQSTTNAKTGTSTLDADVRSIKCEAGARPRNVFQAIGLLNAPRDKNAEYFSNAEDDRPELAGQETILDCMIGADDGHGYVIHNKEGAEHLFAQWNGADRPACRKKVQARVDLAKFHVVPGHANPDAREITTFMPAYLYRILRANQKQTAEPAAAAAAEPSKKRKTAPTESAGDAKRVAVDGKGTLGWKNMATYFEIERLKPSILRMAATGKATHAEAYDKFMKTWYDRLAGQIMNVPIGDEFNAICSAAEAEHARTAEKLPPSQLLAIHMLVGWLFHSADGQAHMQGSRARWAAVDEAQEEKKKKKASAAAAMSDD